MFLNRSSVKSTLIHHPQPIKPPPVAFIPFLSSSLSSPRQTVSMDNDNENISVGNVCSNVFIELGRPLYSFSFSLFSISHGQRRLLSSHKIVKSFDELQTMHNAIVKDVGSSDDLPNFPTTTWLSYSTRLEVLKQRQAFLKEYFVSLISCKAFLSCHKAHKHLNIPSRASEYLLQLG
uniref:PX domain-containing protein n=1 Tax=Vannella robusta TaxID=1487602 RepID=A0A7S4MHX2_9EUKA|mmetsp:Transcript_2306/g.2830  ORF Transcript_2306/g.2830 Transcript_2306/m.2830 type:complete len:177 (+) Transcript_2306:21-551(+)